MNFVEIAEGAVLIVTVLLAYQVFRDNNDSNNDDDQ